MGELKASLLEATIWNLKQGRNNGNLSCEALAEFLQNVLDDGKEQQKKTENLIRVMMSSSTYLSNVSRHWGKEGIVFLPGDAKELKKAISDIAESDDFWPTIKTDMQR